MATLTATPLYRSYRIHNIDFLRGLVMIIMALDHARDLLHYGAMTEDPLNLQTTTPVLFFTRWMTHFCAPVFVFLSGTSIYLQGLRKSKKELSIFLLKRGAWLIIAEVVLVSFGISFDVQWTFVFLQVIWAIGISMILLAALIWMPFRLWLALGALIVLGHNLLDSYEATQKGSFSFFYSLLHRQQFIPINGRVLGILYPFLPWTGVMLLGYCFGRLFSHVTDDKKRRAWIVTIGAALILLFIVLRFINSYGDPLPWATQQTFGRTVLSFLNTQKYPPSLQFLCMTLGPALVLLAVMGNAKNKVTEIIAVFGRVPFFYYLLHFYLLHLVAVVVFLARGGTVAEGLKGVPGLPFKFVVPGQGLHLWQVYGVWLAVVALLYPLCRWYNRYKQTHNHWWLSYV